MTAYDRAGRPAPLEIRLKQAENALEVDFTGGHKARFTAEFLRVESPSAEVKGHGPGQRTTVPGKRRVAITAIEPVGRYAVRISFDDGHDTGLFSWEWFYNTSLEQDRLWSAYLAALKEKGLSR